eukprot:CAMPEP_0178997402 /NCGR_PEP_ID=MMETSP0795-20121207/8903_1 /TAXON_ID=88552 /ORGANISM="Amoebophrya sp., Strain Ameob2" /LENGTH=80 /DNA_ID=CAMNT_0020689897 /DNA_START=387 /DNA_END=630 /DNA_ORIENTATION=+
MAVYAPAGSVCMMQQPPADVRRGRRDARVESSSSPLQSLVLADVWGWLGTRGLCAFPAQRSPDERGKQAAEKVHPIYDYD